MRYLIFNKPYGIFSQFSRAANTLKNYIQVEDVYPVGRLDRDSEGLLLLTEDGQFQHRLSHPSFQHPRTYWAQVEGLPDEQRRGVNIQGYRTRPAGVRMLVAEPHLPPRDPPIRWRKTVPTAWIELTLVEGRNRQVRRMTAAVGHPTLRLVRVATGHVTIGELRPGEWRELSFDEVRRLHQPIQR